MQIFVHRPMVNFFDFGQYCDKNIPMDHGAVPVIMNTDFATNELIYMCVRYMMHSCIHVCRLSFLIHLP